MPSPPIALAAQEPVRPKPLADRPSYDLRARYPASFRRLVERTQRGLMQAHEHAHTAPGRWLAPALSFRDIPYSMKLGYHHYGSATRRCPRTREDTHMNTANPCPVAELHRQAIAAIDGAATPEAAREASERALGLREAQTYAIAASREGIELQKLGLDLAIDGEEWDKAERLLRLIRQGVEGLPA
jgi:hypothetical protein